MGEHFAIMEVQRDVCGQPIIQSEHYMYYMFRKSSSDLLEVELKTSVMSAWEKR